MKRNTKKVPQFDEIIFENRNKNYGAFDLRKRYKSTASLSILGGVSIVTLVVLAIFFQTEEGIATTGSNGGIIIDVIPFTPEKAIPVETKPPEALIKHTRNLAPEVTTDTSLVTKDLPIADDITKGITNGPPVDTIAYVDPEPPVIPVDPEPKIIVDEMPEFPGGTSALLKYVSEKLVYPLQAQEINLQGRVTLRFVVKSDGSVDRISVIGSVDPLLDNEALRVVGTLPKFKPGRHNGVEVPVWFTLPVIFKLKDK
jgi:protein TonB